MTTYEIRSNDGRLPIFTIETVSAEAAALYAVEQMYGAGLAAKRRGERTGDFGIFQAYRTGADIPSVGFTFSVSSVA